MSNVARRSFDSIRAPAQQPVNMDDKYLAAAFARLVKTPDGQLLRAWLHQKYTLARVPHDASDSALRMTEGARQVPADFELMVKRGEREFIGDK